MRGSRYYVFVCCIFAVVIQNSLYTYKEVIWIIETMGTEASIDFQ